MTNMKRISSTLGVIGVALLFAGLISLYINWVWGWFDYVAVLSGAAFIVIFLAINFREIIEAISYRGVLQTGNAVLMSVLVFVLLGFVNFLAGRYNFRVDTTAARQFSLSEQTIKVLQGLQDKLNVTAFFQSTDQHLIADLLKEYAAITPNFTYEFSDPDRSPSLAREFSITEYNTSIVSYKGINEKTSAHSEEPLTNAIIKVTRDKKKKIYFTTFHSEKSIDSDGRLGMSVAKKAIEQKNYEVTSVTLMDSGRVPSDCSVLVIAGAKRSFFDAEIEMIRKYFKLGGSALFLLDPERPSFKQLLDRYGVEAGNNFVVDRSGMGQLVGASPTMPVVSTYEDHDITKNFGQHMTTYPEARSVTPIESLPEGVRATSFAKTSARSWGETNIADLKNGEVGLDEQKDLPGPVSIAVAATRSASANLENDASGEGAKDNRIVVFGDSDFAANYLFDFQKNGDLFLNALSWLAEEEDLISISPKNPEDRRINLTASGSKILLLFSVFLLPLASFMVAVAIYMQRR